MRRIGVIFAGAVCSLWLLGGLAWAQSSGSFTYGSNSKTEHCVLNNDNTGTIQGGQTCSSSIGSPCTTNSDCTTSGTICVNPDSDPNAGVCAASASGTCTTNNDCTSPDVCFNQGNTVDGGTCVLLATNSNNQCIGSFAAGIKTNSGNGNVFVITPSAVVGLLTDAKVSKSSSLDVGTSSALAGVDFWVSISPQNGQPSPTLTPDYAVTYDSRFVQISTNLFDQLGTTCETSTGCYISFDESTVSAHSFQWIASGLSSGQYDVAVNWSSSLGDFGIANSMTCVGPVNLTVEQNKVFNFNTVNSL